jgi:hypothetical protein
MEKKIIVKTPALFSYKMDKSLADIILNNVTKKQRSNPQKILCAWVDNNCGLLYRCSKVIVS